MTRPAPDATRPAGRARRIFGGLRSAWALVGLTLLLILGLELGLRLAFAVKDAAWPLVHPDPRVVAEGYGGAEWAGPLIREAEAMDLDWHPYVYFRSQPFEGRHIRVDERGVRRTWSPPRDEGEGGDEGAAERPRVWVFGGSSAWGVGARDDFTIPSLIAKDLAARGLEVEVTNLAEIGYVSTQEVVALMLELRAGRRPDVVVFYDGLNDVTAAYQSGAAGWPQNEVNRRREFADRRRPGRLVAAGLRAWLLDSATWRLAQAISGRLWRGPGPALDLPPLAPNPLGREALADAVLDTYRANRRLVGVLAREYGFGALFYWQPVLFTREALDPFERGQREKWSAFEPLFLATYRRARERVDEECPAFHDLSRVLDREPGLVFIDFCHTTEAANARIAPRIADDVARLLEGDESAGP